MFVRNQLIGIYRPIVAALATTLVAGCMYIPTFEHGLVSGRAMISDRDIETLKPGETTRADILLRFGDASERLEDDAFLCYQWERVQGFVGAFGGSSSEIGKVYYFCAQFSADNIYVRGKRINALLFGDATKQRDAVLKAWNEPETDPAPTGSAP